MTANRISRAGIAYAGFAFSIATALATPAVAQEAAAPAESAQASEEGLEDIIVTAQRRKESLQDVPISVAAVNSETLDDAGLNSTADIPQIVPSVQVTRSGSSGLFFVRGVGTTNAAGGEEGSNAVYIDNVYLGDLSQTFSEFNNIERIEVLKGPQGTLFGRNATGGLIHIITRDPGDEWELKGQFGYGNYQTVNAQAYIGGPVAENLRADLALTQSYQGDGWGRNLTRGTDNKLGNFVGARSKWVFEPSSAVKITAIGDYYKKEDNWGLGWRIGDGTLGQSIPAGGWPSPGGHDTTSDRAAISQTKNWGLSLAGEFDLGFATLTSISAYRKSRVYGNFDTDGGPQNLVHLETLGPAKTIQQEFRLASNDTTPLSWQVGLFYLRSIAAVDLTLSGLIFNGFGLAQQDVNSRMATDSYAAFGEVTYAITSSTQLTAGLRFTADRRKFDATVQNVPLVGALPAATIIDKKLNYDEFTYRVALRQEITDNISAYASLNRGFKAGAFSLQTPTGPAVNPQFIMAYEVGLKTELFDRKLRLNVAAFHYDISDYQVRSAAGATGTSLLLNAATVKVDGIDVEFEAAPTREWRLFGGLSILDSRFTSFGGPGAAFQAPITYPSPATCPAALRGTRDPGVLSPGPRTGGITTCFGDVSGNPTPLAPKFAASIGTTYTVPVGQSGELRLTALYSFNNGYALETDAVRRQESFSLINASIEYRPVENIGIEIWAKNLTDTEYVVQDLTQGTGVAEVLAPPRTYGINLKFSF